MERLLIMVHVVLGTCGDAESEKGQTLNGSPKDRANTAKCLRGEGVGGWEAN
jgi:hypothetical protein